MTERLKYLILVIFIWAMGCGVKNDPVPPVTPEEIGHGKPLYKQKSQDAESKSKNEKTEEEQQ
jgi:hypothetical protein